MTRILIIDDDKTVPRFLQEALREAGNEVEIATDAEEGLARAKQEDFDVVITDLHWDIPDTKRLEPKGLNLIDQLHQAMPQLPIIPMTAKPDTETTIEATRRGALDYLSKPCNSEEMDRLVNTVRQAALSGRKEARSLSAASGSPGRTSLV